MIFPWFSALKISCPKSNLFEIYTFRNSSFWFYKLDLEYNMRLEKTYIVLLAGSAVAYMKI